MKTAGYANGVRRSRARRLLLAIAAPASLTVAALPSVAVATLTWVGCAAHQTAPRGKAPGAAPKLETPFDKALAQARAQRGALFAHPAPRYTGDGSKPSSLAFLNGDLKSWVTDMKPKVDHAIESYASAFESAPGDSERAEVDADRGELWAWFADQGVSAAMGAMPKDIKAEAAMARAFRAALLSAVETEHSLAARAAERCLKFSKRSPSASAFAGRCQALLARLPRSEDRSTKAALPPLAERPFITSTQPEPCVFRGSLRIRAMLYGSDREGEPVAALDGYGLVEVDALSLPARPSDRAKLTVTWPMKMTAWLDAEAVPLGLADKLDIVKGHVWLSAGQRVSAASVRGGAAEVHARFFKLGSRDPKPDPAELVRRLSCKTLELAARPPELPEPSGEWKKLNFGKIPLFDRANGRRVAELVGGGGAFVLEQSGDWAKVRGFQPFEFVGWVHTASVGAAAGPMGVVAEMPVGRSHDVTAPLALRTSSERSAPVVAELAVGAPVRIGAKHGDFVEILSVAGIGGAPAEDPRVFAESMNLPADRQPPFFALADDVARSTKVVNP